MLKEFFFLHIKKKASPKNILTAVRKIVKEILFEVMALKNIYCMCYFTIGNTLVRLVK